MLSNAKWRENVRKETLQKAELKLKAENEQLEKEQASVIKYFVYLFYFLN